jgi:hypothetical protein
VRERIKAGVFSEVPEVYQVNITASAAEDLISVHASLSGGDLRAAFAHDLGKRAYFMISAFKRITLISSGGL